MEFQKKHKSFLASLYFILMALLVSKAIDYLLNEIFIHLVSNYSLVKGGFKPNFKNINQIVKAVFKVIIFIPLIETALFQYFIINLLKTSERFEKNEVLIIIISAFLFALSHYYSIYYIIITFFAGCILAYSFLASKNFKIKPFWLVFTIHALFNLISFLVEFYQYRYS
ncbi:CPBP family intramembrane metalloprotease [Pedobacter sp. SD-b]|uniref:CPBP family intramembrane metalloprotease n=1 Tax=Pedobacter segetis TaxID=2793069 RepID=A0ABS1BL51_9SPHI|nr:CPBP family intramembrane glutamic endopeptidase [Pedobacter segetis]MBK0383051.1 CPBP family intramembrane metalloprotease [Pedobacter segetis]